MRELIYDLGGRHVMYAILACVVLVILWTLERRSRSNESNFHFDDLLLDENGKTSKPACVMFGSFVVTTWVIVFLAANEKLTEGYFGAYIAAWVAPVVAVIIKGPPVQQTSSTTKIETTTKVEK
jgi:uncharacterized membrane protein